MVVEVYLRNKQPNHEELPETILELENLLGEIRSSYGKLRESTDILTEECRAATSETEALEYYSYVQDNLVILEAKSDLMKRIEAKINQIRGVFPSLPSEEATEYEEQLASDSGHLI